jgi:conjugal transfer pilin signal peptidase TrbI
MPEISATGQHRPQLTQRTLVLLSRVLLWIDRIFRRPHIRPFALAFIITGLLLTTVVYSASPWYELIVNRSDSLPGSVYFLDKTKAPLCGDTTVLDMPVESRFYRGWRLIKIIKGCTGDVISNNGQEIFINNHSAGVSMARTSNNQYELFPIGVGAIPGDKVYLATSHRNSYDSRYASFGLRDRSELLGTAYLLF